MKNINKGIIAAVLMSGVVFVSGCSARETLSLLWGGGDEETTTQSQEIFDPDAVTVDSSVEAPSFTTDLEGNSIYAIGDDAETLKVKAEVKGEGKITYQWYKNTVNSNGGGMIIEGATDNSYKPDTSEEGYWYFFVVATNTVDNAMNMATSGMYQIYVDPDKAPSEQQGDLESGWTQDDTGWYYVNENGNKVVSDWAQVDGKWYLFDDKGYMITGWSQVGETWYYLNDDGSMATGWITVGDKRYFLEDSGAMHTGWLDSDGSWFYAGEDGAIKVGEWSEIDGSWYYFNDDGIMLSNTEVNGRWLNPDGRLAE